MNTVLNGSRIGASFSSNTVPLTVTDWAEAIFALIKKIKTNKLGKTFFILFVILANHLLLLTYRINTNIIDYSHNKKYIF